MLSKINIRNFKALRDTGDILLDDAVVLIGANNTGKTTALQALSLWQLGIAKWLEKRPTTISFSTKKNKTSNKRTGVPINRKDIFAIPVRSNKLMWSDLFTLQSDRDESGKIKGNKDVNIEIIVEGITHGEQWKCGLEFEYRDEEVIYVRPLKNFEHNALIEKQHLLKEVRATFLPPMSGLKEREEKLIPETIDARIGEGRTAEVLRNICYQVCNPETSSQKGNRNPENDWNYLTDVIERLFSVKLEKPELDGRGEFELYYSDKKKNKLEIASAGRGLQQTLLLVSYFLIKPGSTLLFDEPNAHLEILKQKEIYNLLKAMAVKNDSQIISASHSEQVLNEAVGEDIVVAFYPFGKPHRINEKKEVLKALRDYGFEHYYLASQKKWVLYLEGSTDLDILIEFAEKLNHPSRGILSDAFVHYLNNNDPAIARNHFTGLKDAYPQLRAVAIYDNVENPLNTIKPLKETCWSWNEIENYFFNKEIFIRFASYKFESDLFEPEEAEKRKKIMEEVLNGEIPGNPLKDKKHSFWKEEKASRWMEKIFNEFYKKLELPERLSKTKFYHLINFLQYEEMEIMEITSKLDLILLAANSQSEL